MLHRAFSVFLFNSKRRNATPERAAENTILPINGPMLVAPILERMKPMKEAAKRRLKEELGIDTRNFEKFYFIYKADVGGNLWGTRVRPCFCRKL